jgi:hypothetical protein
VLSCYAAQSCKSLFALSLHHVLGVTKIGVQTKKIASNLIYFLLTANHGHNFCLSQVMLGLVNLCHAAFPEPDLEPCLIEQPS